MNREAVCESVTESSAGTALQFRKDLRLFAPREDAGDRRHTVYDPQSDLSFFLGAAELTVARLFDGRRSPEDIIAALQRETGKSLSLDKLKAYESKLLELGLLTSPSQKSARKVMDPAMGISYGPLKAMLLIPVLRMDPGRMLDALYQQARWLCSTWFFFGCLLVVALAAAGLIASWDRFSLDTRAIYGGSAQWLLWHYPVVVVSIFFHEIGHALSCRHYKVRITDFGIAVYLLLATGWARPLQADWNMLPRGQRLNTIFMGPFASVLFAAAGVLLWLGSSPPQDIPGATPPPSFLASLGVVMTVSSMAALIPTLMPMFNGDTYLAVTELIGMPRLRQRAFRYIKDLGSKQPHEGNLSVRRRALYWGTVIGTVVGWLVVWFLLARGAVTAFEWLSQRIASS